MTETSFSTPPAPHAEYRRRARRIRRVFARQPGPRMRALCDLAHTTNADRAETAPDPVITLPAGAAHTFAGVVRQRMDGPVLRYSHRARLLREAEQRGIGRFEANLIIAAVQHQRRPVRSESDPVTSRSSWTPIFAGFCATQCAVLMGLWWLIG